MILGAVNKLIVDKEYKEYRKYFGAMKRLLSIKDQLQDFRINYSMSILLQSIQK